jgi:hypothetical protein
MNVNGPEVPEYELLIGMWNQKCCFPRGWVLNGHAIYDPAGFITN